MKALLRPSCAAALLALSIAPVAAQEPVPPSLGPAKADAEIEVFLAFDSESSARASVVVHALLHGHPEAVRLLFRHLVPEDHPAAALVHRAALAAAAQDQFWEMSRLLFANGSRHSRDDLFGMARQLGLNLTRFAADLDAPEAEAVFDADRRRAAALGVERAPAYLVNGTLLRDFRTLRELETLLGVRRAQ